MLAAMRHYICFLVLLGWASTIPTEGDTPWFSRHLVGMEVGPTGAQFGGDAKDLGFARRFDGREIVRKCVEAHSEYLVIWARDGEFAYYDSALLPKPAGLGDREVLRETIEAARPHRLPVIAYCQLQYPAYELRHHEDWKMRDIHGNAINNLVCFNSPYTNVVTRLLDEMLDYGIDGFHLDMVDQGFGPPHGCWCRRCQTLFQAEYGSPMPREISWDADWERMLEFRYQTSERFERMLYAHVKASHPRTTVDFNYHGNPPFSWEVGQRPVQHADNGDFVTGETGQWGFSALGVGLNAQWYRATTPHKPYQVAIQRGVRMYHDQTTRPLQDIRWELFTLLAHGAFVTMVDKTAYDGWLDPVAYRRIGTAFQEARAKRSHFGHRPLYDVALFFSARTRDWYARGEPARYFQSFQGAHKACVYEHLMFGVLFDEKLKPETLQNFPVVCLPNAAILSSEEVDTFRHYVEAGGRLVITGQSGQYDRLGNPLEDSRLNDLIGARVARRLKSEDNWMRFPAGDSGNDDPQSRALQGDIPSDWPFLVKGPATVYEPTTASAIGELLKPHRTLLQRQGKQETNWPMSADAAVGPAILIHSLGNGVVLTFAASPDYSTASEHHITETRHALANAVRFLLAHPRLKISAPANVETIVTDDPNQRTLRVHCIAYNALPQTTPAKNRPFILPGLIEDQPIYRITLTPRDPIQNVQVWNPETTWTYQENRIEALIQNIHEVFILRY